MPTPDSSATELEQVPCPLCDSEESTELAREGPLVLRRCQRCALAYVSPRARGSQVHYRRSAHVYLEKYGPVLRGESSHIRDGNYRESVAALKQCVEGRRLLDVGSHCGFFLRIARAAGWEACGIEPSPAASELARVYFGLDVRTGTLRETALPDESFDAATLMDVIEHLEDPLAELREVHRVLKPEGILLVKTPNVKYSLIKASLAPYVGRLFERDLLDAKEHIVQYETATLRLALAAAGFELVRTYVPRPIQAGPGWKRAARLIPYYASRALQWTASANADRASADIVALARKSRRPQQARLAERPRVNPIRLPAIVRFLSSR